MLSTIDVIATIAVKDLAVAKTFYEGILELEAIHHEGCEVIVYRSGHSSLNVYRSDYAGTNQATAVTWSVPDIEACARDLAARGVVFEHYDMPGIQREGDIHVAGKMKAAWFKDPDGNILNIVSA